MRLFRPAVIAMLLSLFAPTASAQVHCRCECRVQLVPWGNGFVRRQVCRRYCWREAPRYEPTPPPYQYEHAYQPPRRQYATPYSAPTIEGHQLSLPSLPDIPPAILAILMMCGAGIVLARIIDHAKAVIAQRRVDRVERQALSARALKRRLEYDSEEADRLIRAYAAEAYRRGRG